MAQKLSVVFSREFLCKIGTNTITFISLQLAILALSYKLLTYFFAINDIFSGLIGVLITIFICFLFCKVKEKLQNRFKLIKYL